MVDRRRPDPEAGRRGLHLARAVEALRAGHWQRAEAELSHDAPEQRGPLMDEAFDLFHTEMEAQFQQLRDDQARASSGLSWFSTLFRSLPVPALMLTRYLLIVRSNDEAAAMLALDEAALRHGLPLRRLLREPDEEAALVAPLLAGLALQRDDLALENLRGDALSVDLRLLPMAGAELHADSEFYLAVLIDRTERLALEKAKETADQARQARELSDSANRAKTALLSRVSHELRTPLNAILGFTQLIEMQQLAPDPQMKAWVRHIHDAGKHLLALVEEILDLNQAETGTLRVRREPVDLLPLLREAAAQHRVVAQARDVAILCEGAIWVADDAVPAGPSPAAWVFGDATRIREVVDNLMSNAVKYNRHGGEVRLRLAGDEPGFVAVEVQDSGVGMDAEQLLHLFEPFNRLGAERRHVPGRGLGLHIARTLARAMGGELAAEAAPDIGSRFTLRLPRADRGLSG